jgi:hypothetical protein
LRCARYSAAGFSCKRSHPATRQSSIVLSRSPNPTAHVAVLAAPDPEGPCSAGARGVKKSAERHHPRISMISARTRPGQHRSHKHHSRHILSGPGEKTGARAGRLLYSGPQVPLSSWTPGMTVVDPAGRR